MSNTNVSDIQKAYKKLIEADPILQGKVKRTSIIRSNVINQSPDVVPWIGIYKKEVSYIPRTLGTSGQSWQLTLISQILIQVYSASSGEQAEDLLEELLKDVMRLLLDNTTLNGTVDMIKDFNVEYRFLSNEGRGLELEETYFQMAMLSVTSEVATG